MKNLLALICLVALACCSTPAQRQQQKNLYNENILSDNIKYYKDITVNICYAGMYVGSNANSITSVPCTPEVEAVAHLFKSN
jgi:hypothetical protein